MPVLLIDPSSRDHSRARWWLAPWSFHSLNQLPTLLLLPLPQPTLSPLFHSSPAPAWLGSGLSGPLSAALCPSVALLAAPARPTSFLPQPAASASSSSSTSPSSSTSSPSSSVGSSASAAPTSTASTSAAVHSSPSSSPSPPSPPSPAAKPRQSNMFVAGLLSGLVVAGLFNPWDRLASVLTSNSQPAARVRLPSLM